MRKRSRLFLVMLYAALVMPAFASGQNEPEFNVSIADKTEEAGLLKKGECRPKPDFYTPASREPHLKSINYFTTQRK